MAALAVKLVALPFLSARADLSHALAAQQDLLAREFQVLADTSYYPASIERTNQLIEGAADRLLFSPGPAFAGAAATRYVEELAMGTEVGLAPVTSVMVRSDEPPLMPVQLEVHGSSTYRGLVTFLRLLEYGPKAVTIERLTVEPDGRYLPDHYDDPVVLKFTATLRLAAMEPLRTWSVEPVVVGEQ